MRRLLRAVPAWGWWSLAAAGFVTLILLTVLWFPRMLRPGFSTNERAQLEQEGTDKLVAAENDRSNAQNNVRTTLLQGIAGAALLTGAYFTYRQLGATREGQITTRYTESVKQLGDTDHLDVRIGGIYALKRLAQDSPDRDAPTIVDLLSAFVRRSRRVESESEEVPADDSRSRTMPDPDVQIALTVLTGLHLSERIAIFRADLDGAELVDADLVGTDLSGAKLNGAKLNDAKLNGADLRGAKLNSAVLIGADLTDAKLHGAELGGVALLIDTNLTAAILNGAKLNGAFLIHARLTGAELRGAELGACLDGADLRGAKLNSAVLIGADLRDADLTDADLNQVASGRITGTPSALPTDWQLVDGYLVGPSANLAGAILSGADLTDADLTKANLTKANLTKANLDQANLTDANLTDANIAEAQLHRAN